MPERNSAAAEQGRAKFLLQAKRMRASLSEPVSWLERFRVFLDGLRLKPLPVLNWAVAVIVAMVPGIIAAAVVGSLIQGQAGMVAGIGILALWELLAALGCFGLSKGILHRCDMPQIRTGK
jgi:hypothetical protein